MRTNTLTDKLTSAVRATCILLSGAVAVLGQQQINLSAGPAAAVLPDGSSVPMWGYSCGAAVGGSTATCAALNKGASGWSPVVITVPTGQGLTIHLTNNLIFGATKIPTSIVIVGQLGGGLGDPTKRVTVGSPAHAGQSSTTWPIVGSGTFTPPSQAARVQSFSTEVEGGQTIPLTWSSLRPGTYLIESGTHPSIQGAMGLIGVLVVTGAPTATGGVETAAGTAYPGITYDAEVPLLLSEIDPAQNNSVSTAVNTAGFSENAVWSGQANGCGNPSSSTYNQCYPPAVNYSPLYYLINGVAFSKSAAAASLFPTTPASVSTPPGKVLVRFVNAGLRMHVPSIVGAQTGSGVNGFSLIAEDGNPLPGTPRVQSEVFLAAGKTYDVLLNGPASGGSSLAVFDRQGSLSANATARDAGMLAYISLNGGALPSGATGLAAVANPDSYPYLISGKAVTISDPSGRRNARCE